MLGDFANILLAALGISFLILIHELGHFLAARLFKVRVEVFSLGFGPRVFGFRRGDTDYRLSLVPLGGYVKMSGEYSDLREGQALAADDLTAKPAWQRAVIFSAGVIVNLAFAFVAFPLAFTLGVPFVAPVLGEVVAGGPAWSAGLRPGDEVLAVDGNPVYGFTDIALEVALADPQGTLLSIRRGDEDFEVLLKPARNVAEGRNEIGVLPAYGRRIAVGENTPAHAAGLRNGDDVVSANGILLDEHPGEIVAQLRGDNAQAGLPMQLVVSRAGELHEARIEPRSLPASDQKLLGVMPMVTRIAALRELALRPDFPLHSQDVLLAVEGREVGDSNSILAALPATADSARALVRRGTASIEIELPAYALEALRAGDVAFEIDDDTTRVRVLPGGAAEQAGLADGDEIASMDGAAVTTYRQLQARVREAGSSFRLSWRSAADGSLQTAMVEARAVPRLDYGFSPMALEVVRKEDFAGALRAGTDGAVNMLRTTWLTLARLFTGQVSTSHLGGIVSISVLTYQFAEWGLPKLLTFLALLSINLAIINILPIPVLDGGQIMFLLLEAVRGKRLSERFLNGMQLAGLAFILALVLYVTYNDIMRLVE